MGSESFTVFMARIRELVLSLRKAGADSTEEEEAVCMLNGLNDEFEPLIQNELSLETVDGRVLAHEKRLQTKEKS